MVLRRSRCGSAPAAPPARASAAGSGSAGAAVRSGFGRGSVLCPGRYAHGELGAVDAPPKVPLGERLRRKRAGAPPPAAAVSRRRVFPLVLLGVVVARGAGPGVVPALRVPAVPRRWRGAGVRGHSAGRDGHPGGRLAGGARGGLLGVLLQAAGEARRSRRHQVGHLPAPEGHLVRRRVRRAGRRAAEGEDDRRHDHGGPDDRRGQPPAQEDVAAWQLLGRHASLAGPAPPAVRRAAQRAHTGGLPLPRHLPGADRGADLRPRDQAAPDVPQEVRHRQPRATRARRS